MPEKRTPDITRSAPQETVAQEGATAQMLGPAGSEALVDPSAAALQLASVKASPPGLSTASMRPLWGAALLRRARKWLPQLVAGECEVCHQISRAGVCADCEALFLKPRPRCQRCGLASAADVCMACVHKPAPHGRAWVAYDYAFPWDGLILQWKFASRNGLTATLAQALIQELRAHPPAPGSCLLPLPLSAQRLRERGYNQAALLAHELAGALGLPCRSDVLLRPLDRVHQAGLSRAQRNTNLQGVFMVDPRHRPWLQGQRVVLVDDVITTGATLRVAAAELLRSGAAAVDVCALARTA